MIQFANKTEFTLARGLANPMSSANLKVNTPDAHKRRLSDLARLAVLRGEIFVSVSGTDGTATVRLIGGGITLWEEGVDFGAQADNHLHAVVDISGVSGAADLELEVECITTGTADATADAWLEVEHPLVISA